MRKIHSIVAAAVCCAPFLFASSAQAAPNLIVNGSFEQPPCAASSGVCAETDQSLDGWKVSDPLLRYTPKYKVPPLKLAPQEGRTWLNLSGMSANANIRQVVAVKKNTNYTLSFYMGTMYFPEGLAGRSSKTVVIVDGKTVLRAKHSTPV